MSLASYADLTMRSRAFPGETHAQRALTRIEMGSMPPGGGLTPAEVELFSDWVQAGAQPGTCGSIELDAGGDAAASNAGPADAAPALDATLRDAGGAREAGPSDAALDAGPSDAAMTAAEASVPGRCLSGQHWDGGSRASPLMTPGQPCLGCHGGSESYFSFAGTLFAAAHEPDDCFGAVANGAAIVILGAGGQRLTLTPNAAGNFIANANLPGPYTVEVRYQGRTRKKTQPQTSGDCNACHSQQGANGAAGRITLP
jgi:hypothetical protein